MNARGRGEEARTDGEDVVVVLHLGASGDGERSGAATRVPSGGEHAGARAGGGGEDRESSGAVACGDREAHQSTREARAPRDVTFGQPGSCASARVDVAERTGRGEGVERSEGFGRLCSDDDGVSGKKFSARAG